MADEPRKSDESRHDQSTLTLRGTFAAWILRHCSRITSSGALIPEIDGLRFLAITAVVLFHTNAYTRGKGGPWMAKLAEGSLLSSALSQGHYGVQFFFIISGFVLFLPFASSHLAGSRPPPLGVYFKRRVSRLEPPYLINLAVAALLLCVTGQAHLRGIVPHLLASMIYVHNVVYSAASTINIVAWSLEVEVQFYLIAPLLALVFTIRRRWLRLTTIAGVAAAAIRFQGAGVANGINVLGNGLNLLGSIQYFLVGALLVDIYLVSWRRAPSTGWRWDVVLVVAWVAFIGVSVVEQIVPLGVSLPLIMLTTTVAAFRGRRVRMFLSNRWIATTGGMCYTIYLYHYFIISLIGRLVLSKMTIDSFAASVILNSIVLVPVILVSCAMLFAFTERPFMKRDWPARLRNAVSRMTTTTTPATPVP